MIELVWPSSKFLPGYIHALERGWSPDNVRGEAAARETLERIAADPRDFIERQVDREARGGPIVLPDGSTVTRLPGYIRWIWDGEFSGTIGFRWQPGTSALPEYCLGHVGFSIVPWKRRRGYGTRALGLLLPEVRAEGLEYVELTTDVGNEASQRIIETNGGVLVERFTKPKQFGENRKALRYRITL